VLAVGVGAYSLAPAGSAKGGPNAPSSGSSTAAPVVRVAGDFGIPGLFDHPGTPQEQCSKVHGSLPSVAHPQTTEEARGYCVRVLTQLRALFPDDVVILRPSVDFDQPNWSAKLVLTPDGNKVPGFVEAYQKAAKDPAKVYYNPTDFAFDGPHGPGTIYYDSSPPGWKSKAQPGGDVPLGDGTSAHLTTRPGGAVTLSGVDSDRHWYELEVDGVTPVYSATGSTMQPEVRGDGNDHEVFPDGHVAVVTNPKPDGHGGYLIKPGTLHVPNPYSADQIRELLKDKDLGAMERAIGPDIAVDFAPKVP
jgi:hypothetical protein